MDTSTEENPVQWLFLDLNAFFASCELQENPALRGKPIIVVQTLTDSACAIAASYAAKAFGIKTGTLVKEARRLCPAVIPVQARHRIYTDYHERILQAVDTCLPVEKVCSIDQVTVDGHRTAGCRGARARLQAQARPARAGRRMPHLFDRHRAERVSSPRSAPTCRSRTAWSSSPRPTLPEVLLGLELQEIYGIGARMEQRLHRAGIVTVAQLWNATPFQLRRVWGGINGVLFHQMLHGVDIQSPSSRYSKSIGHQQVLGPELRTNDGARTFAQHLLTKAAEPLRRGDYYCRRLGLHISWVADLGGWWDETDFLETRDTGFLLARLDELWPRAPRYKPLSVGVVLHLRCIHWIGNFGRRLGTDRAEPEPTELAPAALSFGLGDQGCGKGWHQALWRDWRGDWWWGPCVPNR